MRSFGQNRCLAFLIIVFSASVVSGATPNQLSEEEKAAGWKLLFDGKTLSGWHSFKKKSPPGKGWAAENGWLHCQAKGGGDLLSDNTYGDFELEWEWKQESKGNSGVKYFVSEKRDQPLGHEYQMIDEAGQPDAKAGNGKRVTGAFYDVLKPDRVPPTQPPGQINNSRIVVRGNGVEHWLNGAKVLDYSCGSEAIKNAVAQSKFRKVSGFGDKITGNILLQDHHTQAWFRNIKIREISN
jgi:hypothetical protein